MGRQSVVPYSPVFKPHTTLVLVGMKEKHDRHESILWCVALLPFLPLLCLLLAVCRAKRFFYVPSWLRTVFPKAHHTLPFFCLLPSPLLPSTHSLRPFRLFLLLLYVPYQSVPWRVYAKRQSRTSFPRLFLFPIHMLCVCLVLCRLAP